MLLNCAVGEDSWESIGPILKEINPDYSLEELMLKLKLQYFGHLTRRADSRKKPDAGKDWRQEEKGTTEDEMVGWHNQLDWHEFEQALGDGKGQGSLACCSPWGRNESDATERLNNNLFARLQLTYPSLRNLAPLSLSVFNLFGQSHVTACLLSDFCHLLSLPDFSRWPDAPSVFTSDICAYLAWPLEPNGI